MQSGDGIPTETSYDGRDDKQWMKSVDGIKPSNELYEKLVEKVGIYRWQGSTGFTDQRVLSHLKPKFQNIKEFGISVLRLYRLCLLICHLICPSFAGKHCITRIAR